MSTTATPTAPILLPETIPLRAAIYCRISKDSGGYGTGVANQEHACRALAARRGFLLAEDGLYVDNDISAYDRKQRPQFERMLTDLAARKVDVIVVWHQDRLTRHPKELERVIDALEAVGAPPIATVQSGDTDLSTPTGRTFARVVGAMARGESEHKSERQKMKVRQLAMAGKPGGMARTYGFDRPRVDDGRPIPGSRIEIVPEEAERIREAAKRILAGDSLYAIVNDWRARGVPTIRGAKWSTTTLRGVLLSARVAGLRVHQGAVVGEADHDAILDKPTWDRIGAILTDPARKTARVKRSYLLTGIVKCGMCGRPLYATPRRHRTSDGRAGLRRSTPGETQRVMGCTKSNGGCGKINVIADGGTGGGIEPFVVAAVLDALRGSDLGRAKERLNRADVDEAADLAEIRDAEAEQSEVGRLYAERRISNAAFVAADRSLQDQIDAAKERLAARPRSTALNGIDDLEVEWEGLSLDRKRAIIRTVIESITVGPATIRNRFDPGRVTLTWLV